jgi:hypothetical protein
MDMFSKNPDDPTFLFYKKFFLYSAHDTNLYIMLDNLGLLPRDCLYDSLIAGDVSTTDKCEVSTPEFASNIIFETIFSKETNQSYIAVRYNGEYFRICAESKIVGITGADESPKKYLCPLEDFNLFIKSRIDPDWQTNCGITKKSSSINYSKYSGLVMLLFVINLVLVILLVMLIMLSWSTKHGYVQSSSEGLKSSLISETSKNSK